MEDLECEPAGLGFILLTAQPSGEPCRQCPLAVGVQWVPLDEIGDLVCARVVGAPTQAGTPQLHTDVEVVLDVHVDLDVGDRNIDGPSVVCSISIPRRSFRHV